MSTPSPEADAELLERVVRQGRETMARLRRARAELSQVTGTGRTSDGMVRAVADGQGGIVELRLDPRVMRLDHVSLGARITAVRQFVWCSAPMPRWLMLAIYCRDMS